jgi:transposase-like protein
LKGVPESIAATWPLAVVQTCVLHLIRNSFRLAGRRDWDQLARDLRPVYTAVNEADAARCLEEFHTIWGNRYPAIRTLWTNAWSEFVPFLDYAPEIRRVIYSTPSSRSTPGSAGPPEPEGTSPTSRRRSNASTSSSDRSTPKGPAKSDG